MALSDILEKIKQEAAARIKELNQSCETKIHELKDEYIRRQADIKSEINEKAETNSQKVIEKAVSLAKMEAKNALLIAKRKIIKETFAKAIEELTGSDDYEKILAHLLRKTKMEIGDGGEVIPAKGRQDVTRKAITNANAKFTLSGQEGDFAGGFIVRAGSIQIDNSFESIIGRELADNLEPEVAQILFS